MASARLSRTSVSVASFPKRPCPNRSAMRPAASGPRSASISISSSASRSDWSSFFLVSVATTCSDSWVEERDSPLASRCIQPGRAPVPGIGATMKPPVSVPPGAAASLMGSM